MTFQIKELTIQVKVEEEAPITQQQPGVSKIDVAALKEEIIRECTNRILETNKEKTER